MSPRIVVDGVFFQFAPTGIARVWTRLLRHWIAAGHADQVLLIDRGGTAPAMPGLRTCPAPLFRYESMEVDRDLVQSLCDEARAEVFISTYYTLPRTTPSLLIVHDMIPEVLGWDLTHPMWAQKHLALARASAMVTISSSTAADLQRFLDRPVPVTVAHCGCDFRPPAADQVLRFRMERGLVRPYFMLSGSRGGYKNAELFLDAFERLGDEREQYGILCTGAGELDPRFAQAAGPADLKRLMLDDDGLQCAYAGAMALVYPSRYEGFGLPVLEAMACGCPVITTRSSSLPEVGGDAAMYVDLGAGDADRMLACLREVRQPERRAAMVEAGLRQATRFRWDDMADKVWGALGEVAGSAAERPGPAVHACRLCAGATKTVFTKRVLARHDVDFQLCQSCGSLQSERPYWLDEAYVPDNERFDTGAVTRTTANAAFLFDVWNRLGSRHRVVDVGCGTGLLVRQLRDAGVDAWGCDKYDASRLALGFKVDTLPRDAILNLCEVAEHFVDPAAEFARLFEADPAVLVIQTGLMTKPDPNWTYLAPEHGQHVFFLSEGGLRWLGRRHGRALLAAGGFVLMVRTDVLAPLLDSADGVPRIAVEATPQRVAEFMLHLVRCGYTHAAADHRRLVQAERVQSDVF